MAYGVEVFCSDSLFACRCSTNTIEDTSPPPTWEQCCSASARICPKKRVRICYRSLYVYFIYIYFVLYYFVFRILFILFYITLYFIVCSFYIIFILFNTFSTTYSTVDDIFIFFSVRLKFSLNCSLLFKSNKSLYLADVSSFVCREWCKYVFLCSLFEVDCEFYSLVRDK